MTVARRMSARVSTAVVLRAYRTKEKALIPYNNPAGTRAVDQNNSCGATRLDAVIRIHSCILTYAFFGNGVCSPARLLHISTRPQKPIHPKSVLPQSHRLRLSVKRPVKLLALPLWFWYTLSRYYWNVKHFFLTRIYKIITIFVTYVRKI